MINDIYFGWYHTHYDPLIWYAKPYTLFRNKDIYAWWIDDAEENASKFAIFV